MPRFDVEHKGKWACFSSISDGFVSEFMDREKYEKWKRIQYGRNYRLMNESNIKTMKEVLFSIHLNRTRREAIECLLESGLSELECEQIIYDMETDYYCPIPKNDKYECPNCGRSVFKEQKSCESEDCCLEFVWRI